MNKLTKVVNIYPSMPITGVNPPIRSVVKRVTKPVKDIRTCLMGRAVVEEILPNGETIRLNIGNYDKVLGVEPKPEIVTGPEKTEEAVVDNKEEKSVWQTAYEKALEGKDLASMSRKQRRSAEAAARAKADEAVRLANEDNASRETEESFETTDIDNSVDEEIMTVDAEDITSIIE